MKVFAAIFAGCSALFAPSLALAHGFGNQIDLPVPFSLYVSAAAAAVVLSFLFLGALKKRHADALSRYPTIDLSRFAVVRALSRPSAIAAIRGISLLSAFGIALAGILGTSSPLENIVPTFVWIILGVGFVYVSAFLGDIWRIVSPARALGLFVRRALGIAPETGGSVPAGLGVWLALGGFFFWRWLENVFPSSGDPAILGGLIIAYLATLAIGSLWFSADDWFDRVDPFAVFFGFLARFSITERREGRLLARPPVVGLFSGERAASVSETAFVLFMLSSVAFDGLSESGVWLSLASPLWSAGIPPILVGTLGLFGLWVVFALAYALVIALMQRLVSSNRSFKELAGTFVVSLLPIAIGYEVAHYVSLLLVNGQEIIPLLSDPAGLGWNLFGTAEYAINYQALDLKLLWHAQVALIVVGHVIAVLVAHVDSLKLFSSAREAAKSQLPMLVLMVGYTIFSLWTLALPIVAGLT